MVTNRTKPDLAPWRDEERERRRVYRKRLVVVATASALAAVAAFGALLLADRTSREVAPPRTAPATTPESTIQEPVSLPTGLYLVSIDDAAVEPFGLDEGPAEGGVVFRYSPDGTRIVFTRTGDDGTNQVWVMDADGSDLRQLTFEPKGAESAEWSQDGRSIAFLSSSLGDVFTMDLATGRVDRVVRSPLAEDDVGFASWGPNGAGIAIEQRGGVRIVDLQTGNASAYIARRAAIPAWSPDGRWIAVDLAGRMVLVSADGADRRLIDEGTAHASAWSPDGRLLAYNRYSSTGEESVWLFDVETGERRLFMERAEQHGWAGNDTLLVQAWG